MNIQADINWIISELRSVQDPNLIEAFKNMLAYRRTKQIEPTESVLSPSQIEELEKRVERHKNGESASYSWEETKEKIRSAYRNK